MQGVWGNGDYRMSLTLARFSCQPLSICTGAMSALGIKQTCRDVRRGEADMALQRESVDPTQTDLIEYGDRPAGEQSSV